MGILKHVRELILSESVDDLIKVVDEEKAKLRDLKPIEDPELFGLKRDSSAELFFPVQKLDQTLRGKLFPARYFKFVFVDISWTEERGDRGGLGL